MTQEVDPPGEKVAATVALLTVAPLLTSRTVTTAEALQLPPDRVELPTIDLNATVCVAGCTGAPLPRE